MLNQDETLILSDNKKYSVVYTTEYNGKKYVYLVDQDDYFNMMFCEYEGDNLEEVNDPNIIEELLKLFTPEEK